MHSLGCFRGSLRARLGLSVFTPCPALCPGPDLPQRISLGQPPSLHLLRGVRYSPVFVRRLLSYYGAVRLPASVRRCRAPCGFTARTPMPLRTRCGTSRLPCMSLGVRAQGLGPRGGGTALAITICSVLPSVPYDAVGPPKFILLSRLNIQPARLPVNASPLLSRTTTHDSGPIWFATPSLGGTCTRETYRFVPAHREVKILMRLPDGRNVATRQAVHGSAP